MTTLTEVTIEADPTVAVIRTARDFAATPEQLFRAHTFEGNPDDVSLETAWFEDLGDGRARPHTRSLCESFEARNAWLTSGMEVGINEGYAELDELLAAQGQSDGAA